MWMFKNTKSVTKQWIKVFLSVKFLELENLDCQSRQIFYTSYCP